MLTLSTKAAARDVVGIDVDSWWPKPVIFFRSGKRLHNMT